MDLVLRRNWCAILWILIPAMAAGVSDAGLQLLFYLPMQLVGFIWWRNAAKKADNASVVKAMSVTSFVVLSIGILAIVALNGWFMAAEQLDHLTVIVSDQETVYDPDVELWHMPLEFRYQMVKRQFKKYDNVTVVKHVDTFGDAQEYDKHGTAIHDVDFWHYWTNVFNILAPDVTHFVSSDRYGQEAARQLSTDNRDVDWFPVDPDRKMVPISATKIRKDPYANWKYINEDFRIFFGQRVLVIGPESVGKTTLTQDLGAYFNSPVVPEYGRILSEMHNNNLVEEDFHDIVNRHHSMEVYAMRTTHTGLTFSDTDAYTTFLFGKYMLNQDLEKIRNKHTPNWYHLVVLIPPKLPWVDDGTRLVPDVAQREWFYKALTRAYRQHKNVMILEETDREKRVQLVANEVAKLVPMPEKAYTKAINGLTKQGVSLSM